ncbi:MAG: hypothetical protein IPH57_02720 [Saprospiraceae bacterium]|nr:hypothetical protein [Saprospiraceae bacterium]
MKRLPDLFYKKTNLFIAILFTVAMVGYASLVLGGKSECFSQQLNEGQKVLGLKLGYTNEYAVSFFNSLDSEGLICYKNLILIWDNIFPILYGIMYILWISLIYRNIDFKYSNFRFLNIFPLFHILMDWTENFAELNLVNQFTVNNSISLVSVKFSSYVSLIKWSSSFITYGILIPGLAMIISKKLKNKYRLS